MDGTSRGASWGADDVIVFATSTSGGLLSVPAAGGEPAMLAAVAAGERAYWFPSVLPDGHGIVYTVAPDDGRPHVAHLDRNGKRTALVDDASLGVYVEDGYLAYAAAGSLWATRFSPATGQVSGAPVRILDEVEVVFGGTGANVALSRRGTLAYVRPPGDPARTLVWIDRDGRETPVPAPAHAYQMPRLSDDDARLVVFMPGSELGNSDLWTWDVSRDAADQTLQRFTFGPRNEAYAAWSPDGRIVYNSGADGVQNIYRRAADSTAAEERLTRGPNSQRPLVVSADGRHLVFEESTSDTAWNLMRLTLDGASTPEVLLRTPFDERNADLSPDGRWMAYESNETGQTEVFVRPFPSVNREVFQVSSNGGRSAAWAPGGGELFFANGSTLYAVAVRLAPAFRHGAPIALFDNPSVIFDARQFTGGSAARRVRRVEGRPALPDDEGRRRGRSAAGAPRDRRLAPLVRERGDSLRARRGHTMRPWHVRTPRRPSGHPEQGPHAGARRCRHSDGAAGAVRCGDRSDGERAPHHGHAGGRRAAASCRCRGMPCSSATTRPPPRRGAS